MADAPKRIWAGRWPHGGRAWRDAPAVHIKTAYVREDLVAALEAENQRLREALREIIDHCANSGRGNALVNDRIYERCEETARAALRSTKEGG